MSVLIRGMKMPKTCCDCEWHEYYGGDYDWCHTCQRTGTMPIKNAENGRAEDCPLAELPNRHMRLIDVDDLFKRLGEANLQCSFFIDGLFIEVTELDSILRDFQLNPIIKIEQEKS